MGKKTTHRLSENVIALGRALRPAERARCTRSLRALLQWQRTLREFPRVRGAPDATPYVSLYARGKLRGCFGSHEGAPSERLVRAFVLSSGDTRYGGIGRDERAELAADVAYITRARPCRADEARAILEPGTHGVAIVRDGVTSVLLPSVARERGYDAAGMLELVAKKAGTAPSDEGIVWVLDVDEVSSRGVSDVDSSRAAKRFLESLVSSDGCVTFEVDRATGAHVHEGVMRHARVAVVVSALRALGSKKSAKATGWLAREIARGVTESPDALLGTLALAAMAGLRVPLDACARSIDATTCLPWHASQAAAVLGAQTPPALWDACVRSLDARPFAPWTLMAARARGDAVVTERCVRALVDSIRTAPPHEGGASVTKTPETALTAVAAEALAPVVTREAKNAVLRARRFLAARQVLDVSAALPAHVLGAYRASPIAPVFRCDITAHAVLARP